MGERAIGAYGLLSDRHSAALVSADGAVDWLCWPRFDSPAVFGALLGRDAGHWSMRPVPAAHGTRRYLPGTMVLQTTYTTSSGTLAVTDALAAGSAGNPHRLGADAPHALIRELHCPTGTVEVSVRLQPRPEYGLVIPLLAQNDDVVVARGGSATLHLHGPAGLVIDVTAGSATGTYHVSAGQTLRFVLQWAPLGAPAPTPWSHERIGTELKSTIDAWRGWSAAHRSYDGPRRDLIRHSGRVLHALSYQPTGAIVAAPSTSLPEAVGGERNWDYRYTWIRDAAFTMDALWVAACPDEAGEFFDFLTTAAATPRTGRGPQIMYGVGGEHDLTERVLDHLPGWRSSRPVRVGNGAWHQTQLDTCGELLETAARYADQLSGDPPLRAFLTRLADTAATAWHQPDHGIWEVRGRPQHFLHSKLMCWVALDRAVTLADRLSAGGRAAEWAAARDDIRNTIETRGWNDATGAYTQTLDGAALDAAALMIPMVGFLPGRHPRVLSTIDAVMARLTDRHGLVHRYDTSTGVDGLAGAEGPFLICTFWLARANALAGRLDAAREVFARAVGYANDLGLLAEQVDPASGELLGNFPQAFSHIGLINAAYTITEAERGQGANHSPHRRPSQLRRRR